ncbi:MAG: hypothetical protein LBE59_02370 [Nevskiaceae bacterium]|jgi:hypothetical protein|nr:hypothetical protein [Nevskiaceae bacterium]
MTNSRMIVSPELPIDLTDEFAHDLSRQMLWQAFTKKNDLAMKPLAVIVDRLRAALEPALKRAVRPPMI